MKLDRLLGILTILLQSDRMTAPALAEKFEVSRRTIGRDIDALCQAGIPVVTHQGVGGGISIAEGFKLDKSVLTTQELSSIVTALKGLGSVSEDANIERTLDKLRFNADTVISMREPIIIDLASHYKGSLTSKIELIKRGVLQARLIEFDYCYEKGESHRCIEPYFVIFQWAAWYVFGFCLERQDFRMFKLTRLSNLTLCDESYYPREIPPDRRDFNARLPDDKKVTAIFDPALKYQLMEANVLGEIVDTPDGAWVEIGYTSSAFIISWLLSFGGKVKVLAPEDVVEGLRAAAANILQRYE